MLEKLRIICLVKVVPDVEHFVYDYERNVLVRENAKSIINQDDACAVAAALNLKKKYGAHVIVMSMGPPSIKGHLEDLIRRGVDRAVLITDALYVGSDTYATANVLARSIQRYKYDMIFCGARSKDGDTSHIPPQLAELLDTNVMSPIVKLEEELTSEVAIQVQVKDGKKEMQFLIKYPAVLGISNESKYKLPFVKYENLKKEVEDDIDVITNEELQFMKHQIGLAGSKTKVVQTYPKRCVNEQQVVVQVNEAGMEYVYQFLKEKGFV